MITTLTDVLVTIDKRTSMSRRVCIIDHINFIDIDGDITKGFADELMRKPVDIIIIHEGKAFFKMLKYENCILGSVRLLGNWLDKLKWRLKGKASARLYFRHGKPLELHDNSISSESSGK